MRKQLQDLRKAMEEAGVDVYLIPSGDCHNSEYVNKHFKCREYVSGFTGSAGTLVVERDSARLWTDGRYFLQAADQLAGSGIQLMKINEPGVPGIVEYLEAKAEEGSYRLGFDGRVISAGTGRRLEEELVTRDVELVWQQDLVADIWQDRPPVEASEIYSLPLKYTGKTAEEKLAAVRGEMKKNGAAHLLISDLTETAWLLNLRGSDIECTPVFYAFTIVSEETVELFVLDPAQFERDLAGELPFVQVRAYDDIYRALADLGKGRIWMSPATASYALCRTLADANDVLWQPTPISMMKAVKNESEIASTRKVHLRDGRCMVSFIFWLKSNVAEMELSEIEASDWLDWERFDAGECYDLSFPTISGYGANGAIIHYQATATTDADLKPEGFLLVDSGGQYDGGTTDITRTISLGPLTKKMKEYYTYVLKSHIALATAVFEPGTTGRELDSIARKPLADQGLDFNHGTGHGIGHMLSVHEGPNTISRRGAECAIVPGMITSNEPGVYIENEFGIRLENEILCVEDGGRYRFETITYCPFDRAAIVKDLLTKDELDWLNSYQKTVYDKLSPRLDPEEAKWLRRETALL
ncbi:MAG: aminopeptidase P family protein [Anaerovoracaceae bacterium]|jgi:Xaa-Pro aminopeptidase